jgi:hypothetical protein
MFLPENIKSIKKKDLVLEVGPGNTPYYRSDVLLEKQFFDEQVQYEQAGRTEKRDLKKRLIYYNKTAFPFKTNEFDYVICSHVLEHITVLELPEFISELERVAPKGYIELPSAMYEVWRPIPTHKSLIIADKGKLFFLDKNKIDFSNTGLKLLWELLSDNAFGKMFYRSVTDHIIGFEWDKKIEFEVLESARTFEDLCLSNFSCCLKKRGIFQRAIKSRFNKNYFFQMLYNRFRIIL